VADDAAVALGAEALGPGRPGEAVRRVGPGRVAGFVPRAGQAVVEAEEDEEQADGEREAAEAAAAEAEAAHAGPPGDGPDPWPRRPARGGGHGVAYGSDTRLARDTLLEVAKAHPRVLDDHPPPRALFLGFGDSALDLELHAAIRNPEERWAVRDELHDAIDAAFRARRIEIAFPQRDLHVRSAPGLAGLVPPGDASEGPEEAEDEPDPDAP